MSKREKKIGQLAILAIMAGGLLVGLLTVRSTPVYAHVVPVTCDFTTGGGFVYNDDGSKVNFGLVAGCKNGGFFGHVNVVNHDTTGMFAGLHISSDKITGYLDPCRNNVCGSPPPTYRDICGVADTNLFGQVYFRARTYDGGEPGSGPKGPDKFGIKICQKDMNGNLACSVYALPQDGGPWLPTRFLQGGNIQLHKNNPSTFYNGPTDESTLCNGVFDDGLGF